MTSESSIEAAPPNVRRRRATSYDVAKAAGVSQPTVSRCFQANSNISKVTRDHVLKIAAELGYTRNTLARSLITQRSNMVGVIATKFTIRNNPDIVFVIDAALKDHGFRLLLMVVENDDAVENILPEALEYPLDGLICCALMKQPDIDRFLSRGQPVVFFNRDLRAPKVDCISTDHAAGGREIAEALFTAGHRRVLCIGGPEGAPVSQARIAGVTDRLIEIGMTDIASVPGNFSYESGRDAFLDAVGGGAKPDAVVCANDQLAMGVMDACRFNLGWRIPEDLSVVGFDDVAEAARPTYELTTIAQDVAPMAKRAVEMLLRRIADPECGTETVLVAGRLIRRSSARLG